MKRQQIWTGYGLAVPLMLAVAGCAAVPTPTPPPRAAPVAAAPTPAPLPAPTKGWEERALDSGAWRYDAGSRAAAFVPTGNANPLLTMACSNGNIRLTSALAGTVSLRTSAGTDPDMCGVGKSVANAREYQGPCRCCLLYTSPSPRDRTRSRMPSSA